MTLTWRLIPDRRRAQVPPWPRWCGTDPAGSPAASPTSTASTAPAGSPSRRRRRRWTGAPAARQRGWGWRPVRAAAARPGGWPCRPWGDSPWTAPASAGSSGWTGCPNFAARRRRTWPRWSWGAAGRSSHCRGSGAAGGPRWAGRAGWPGYGWAWWGGWQAVHEWGSSPGQEGGAGPSCWTVWTLMIPVDTEIQAECTSWILTKPGDMQQNRLSIEDELYKKSPTLHEKCLRIFWKKVRRMDH